MFSKALLVGALAASTIAQTTTLNLFVDGDSDEKFEGSIVSADCDATTIALRCTAGDYSVGPQVVTCDPSGEILATYGPNSYEVSTKATQAGTAVTLLETCSISGSTQAVCSFSIGAELGGQSTHTASSTTLTDINHYQIPITAGVDKLPQCTNAAGSSTSGNAAAPTGITDVYKVLVVPAAILAGALA